MPSTAIGRIANKPCMPPNMCECRQRDARWSNRRYIYIYVYIYPFLSINICTCVRTHSGGREDDEPRAPWARFPSFIHESDAIHACDLRPQALQATLEELGERGGGLEEHSDLLGSARDIATRFVKGFKETSTSAGAC